MSAGSAATTCAGSAASAGTNARGTKRSSGACPGGITRHTATAAGTPETGNGNSDESATAGRPASLAGYHRCRSRKSGRATWASASSPGDQTSASGADADSGDWVDAYDTTDLRSDKEPPKNSRPPPGVPLWPEESEVGRSRSGRGAAVADAGSFASIAEPEFAVPKTPTILRRVSASSAPAAPAGRHCSHR